MTDQLFELVPVYGAWIVFLTTYLSCLALPFPASFIMLAGGAFLASGDLTYSQTLGSAWLGAVLGDQTGLWVGKTGGSRILARLEGASKTAPTILKARALMARWGGISVFLSRWLFSPVGPYINFIAGAGHIRWGVFTVWSILGEAVWVTIYVFLGYSFAGQITLIADFASNAVGLVTAGAATTLLGRAVFR